MKHCNRDCPDSDLGNCNHPSNCAKLELGIEDFMSVVSEAYPDTMPLKVMMQTDPHKSVISPNLRWMHLSITRDMFKDFLILEPATPEYPIPKVRLEANCLSKDHFYGRYVHVDQPTGTKYIALEILSHIYPPYIEPKLGEPMTKSTFTEINLRVVFLDEADLRYYKVVRIQVDDQPPHVWKSGSPVMYMEPVYGEQCPKCGASMIDIFSGNKHNVKNCGNPRPAVANSTES